MGTTPSDLSITGSLQLDIALFGLGLIASAFFSGTETAITAMSEHRARQLLDGHPRRYRSLRLWLDRPNRVLTTILIGNNVVNTFTAALATLIAQQLFKSSVLSAAVGITTVLILIVGEITPKTFAKHNAERMAPAAMTLISLLYYGLFPLVVLFTSLSKLLVRITGGQVTRTGPFLTEEDLTYMIHLSHREGVIEKQEQELISSIFEFGDTLVKEVMIPRTEIVGIRLGSTAADVIATTHDGGHTRMPVYGDDLDDIRGIFHAKELLRVLPDGVDAFELAHHVRRPFFVPELMRISELLKEFQRRKTHLAVVHDEYGGTAGIVCLEDILEEIVGEIRDEYDADEEEDVRKIDDDHYVVDGRAKVSDLFDELGISLPDDANYETLGGFFISEVGRMPPRGQRLRRSGWLFVAAEVESRRVRRVEIERLPFKAGDDDDDGQSEVSGPNPELKIINGGTSSP